MKRFKSFRSVSCIRPLIMVIAMVTAAGQAFADYDVTVSSATGTNGSWSGASPDVWTPSGAGSNVSVADIQARLNAGTDVLLTTAGGGAQNGDILANHAVSWGANATLTFSAYRNVTIYSSITATGNTAGLVLLPNNTGAGGGYSLNNGAVITLSGATPGLTIAGTAYTVINDLNALQNMGAGLAGSYALGSNIDASATSTWNVGAGFVPVGTAPVGTFTGTFDGLNHTITRLNINRPSTDYVGLFGAINGATIRNVGLVGGSVAGGSRVGGLVGNNSSGAITNSSSTGSVAGVSLVGGLVGNNYWYASISNSSSTGSVTGTGSYIGGLAGNNQSSSTITNSYSTGDVNSGIGEVGGLVGYTNGTITNSYSRGSVAGNNATGGLAGNCNGAITNSYATGSVTSGAVNVGGLVGLGSAAITDSFWDNQASGRSNCFGGSGSGTCTGLATTDMMKQASFSNWDFTNTWFIYEGNSYPLLRFYQLRNNDFETDPHGTVPPDITGWSFDFYTINDAGTRGTGPDVVHQLNTTTARSFSGAKSVYSFVRNVSNGDNGDPNTRHANQDLTSTTPFATSSDTLYLWRSDVAYTTSLRYAWRIEVELSDGITTTSNWLACHAWGNGEGCPGNTVNTSDLTATGSDGQTWHRHPIPIPSEMNRHNLSITIRHQQDSWDGGTAESGLYYDLVTDLNGDIDPEPFSFASQTGAALSSLATSSSVVVSGINTASPVSIAGGEYQLNGGSWVSSAGAVTQGDTVTVRQASSGNNLTKTDATLTIGGVSGIFSVTTIPAPVPDAFAFVDQTDVAVSTLVTANTITVSGISTAAAVSITGGEYRINGGGWTTAAGTVNNGDAVTVRQTSSSDFSATTNAVLAIGGGLDTFSVTTIAADTTPDAFSFTDQTGLPLSTPVLSGTITVSGINTAANISITGGEYQINSSGWTAAAGTVNNGDTVLARQTSSSNFSTTTDAVLTIGGISDTFSVTTSSPCVTPPSGLVSWWGGDNNTLDLISANSGTLMNGAAYTAGKVGPAFIFDGVDDYIDLGSSPGFDLGDFTLGAWVYIDASTNTGERRLISRDDYGQEGTDGREYFILKTSSPGNCGAGNRPLLEVSAGGTLCSPSDLTTGWHHIAATREASALALYVDGVSVANASGGGLGVISPDAPLVIGTINQTEMFQGLADEITVFNRALSASEIQGIYNAGGTGVCRSCTAQPAGMVSWWDGEVDAKDRLGLNHGTMNGVTNAAGKSGQAFSFDGAGAYVSLGTSAGNFGSSDYSLSFWIKTTATPAWFMEIMNKRGGGMPSGWWEIRMDHSGILFTEGVSGLANTTPINDGKFHRVDFTRQGTLNSLYIDGYLESSAASEIYDMTSSVEMVIGYPGYPDGTVFFHGLIDEVQIFSRSLSADEIAAAYNAGSAGICSDTAPDSFNFTAQTGVAISTLVSSNTIAVLGINTPAPVSITGGEYLVSNGTWTSATGTVSNNDVLTVRQTSSGAYTAQTDAVLTIGGVSGTFSVATPVAVNGACGISGGQTFTTAPATDLCSSGTTTVVTGSGPWNWTCGGQYTGADADCSANIQTYTLTFQADGNGTLTGASMQTINHGGNATAVTANANTNYHFVNWTGTGGFSTTTSNPLTVTNVTSSMTITANFAHDAVNGACGISSGLTFTTTPATNLCSAGTTTGVTGSGPWNWTCSGQYTGTDASCSANIQTYTLTFQADSNGTLTGTAIQTINHGGSATAITANANTNYHFVNWTGTGGFSTTTSNPLTAANVTSSMTITANFAHDAVNGACGTSSGQTIITAPTLNLCSSGTTTGVTGSGPWNWTCGGQYTGTDADCSANIQTYSVTFASDGNGTLSGTSIQTINHGGNATAVTANANTSYHFVNWTGTGGFSTTTSNPLTAANVTSSMTITANFTHDAVNGACGTSSGQTFTTAPATNLCSSGTSTAFAGSGPWTWTCGGQYSGTDASCSANIQTWLVTPSAGAGGTISPSTPQTVNNNAASSFTITPNTGYSVSSVTGCGGNFTGNIYTTGQVTGNCAVTASFTANPAPTTPSGDLTGDGTVEMTDALKALRIAAGLDAVTAGDISKGDVAPLVNGVPQPDGKIDVGDVVVILRKAVGLW